MEKLPIGRKFYARDTKTVAQELLGCFLVRKIKNKIIKAEIIETEAYVGEDDMACHASKGRTPRTEMMYGEAGRAYVYMIYGMYHCLNIVTEKEDFPAAVLIRGLANLSEWKISKSQWTPVKSAPKLDGPGKLCRYFEIDRNLNHWDLTKGEKLWIEKSARNNSAKNILSGRRIGVDYAGPCKNYLWRYYIKAK